MKTILEYVINQKIKNQYNILDSDIKSFTYNHPIECNHVKILFNRPKLEDLYAKLSFDFKRRLFDDLSKFLEKYNIQKTLELNMYIPIFGTTQNNEQVFFGLKNVKKDIVYMIIDYFSKKRKFECKNAQNDNLLHEEDIKKMIKEIA